MNELSEIDRLIIEGEASEKRERDALVGAGESELRLNALAASLTAKFHRSRTLEEREAFRIAMSAAEASRVSRFSDKSDLPADTSMATNSPSERRAVAPDGRMVADAANEVKDDTILHGLTTTTAGGNEPMVQVSAPTALGRISGDDPELARATDSTSRLAGMNTAHKGPKSPVPASHNSHWGSFWSPGRRPSGTQTPRTQEPHANPDIVWGSAKLTLVLPHTDHQGSAVQSLEDLDTLVYGRARANNTELLAWSARYRNIIRHIYRAVWGEWQRRNVAVRVPGESSLHDTSLAPSHEASDSSIWVAVLAHQNVSEMECWSSCLRECSRFAEREVVSCRIQLANEARWRRMAQVAPVQRFARIPQPVGQRCAMCRVPASYLVNPLDIDPMLLVQPALDITAPVALCKCCSFAMSINSSGVETEDGSPKSRSLERTIDLGLVNALVERLRVQQPSGNLRVPHEGRYQWHPLDVSRTTQRSDQLEIVADGTSRRG